MAHSRCSLDRTLAKKKLRCHVFKVRSKQVHQEQNILYLLWEWGFMLLQGPCFLGQAG